MKFLKSAKNIIAIAVICALVLGYYVYLTNKTADKNTNKKVTKQDELLALDLDGDGYPQNPEEVVKLYSQMIQQIYNRKLSGKDLSQMVTQSRKMFDEELAKANEQNDQVKALNEEIKKHNKDTDLISNFSVSEGSQVVYGQVDGKECAQVEILYNIKFKSGRVKIPELYILRKDKNGLWKILGWKSQQESKTTQESK